MSQKQGSLHQFHYKHCSDEKDQHAMDRARRARALLPWEDREATAAGGSMMGGEGQWPDAMEKDIKI